MEKVSKVLTDYIIHKGMINEKDRHIYEYGFIITMELGVFGVFCLITALYLHMLFEGILFFVIFVPLRSYAGGLHLEKFYSCMILSCLTFLGILVMTKYIQLSIAFSFAMLCVLEIAVYMLYPVENVNRKVDKKENYYFIRKLKLYLFIDMIIAMVCIILKNGRELFLITITFLIVVITMLIGKYKNRNMFFTSE